MGEKQDYYSILGVASSSEDVVIQAAYRALMRRYHPDTNSSADASARAKAINEAYAVLSDPAKRKAYDQSRARQTNGGGGAKQPPPPPPPPPKREPAPSKEDAQKSSTDRSGLVITMIVVAIFAALIVVASFGSASPTDDNTMNVDNLAVDNLVVNDTNDFDAANMDMNATDANMTDASSNLVVPQFGSPGNLGGTPEALRYEDIEGAADKLAKILFSSGMLGARKYSEDCHRRFAEQVSWSNADHCAAFDYAAAFVDAQVSAAGKVGADTYFRFQRDNQADGYVSAGAFSYTVETRLTRIRSAAESAAREAIEGELAMREARAKKNSPKPVLLNSETSLGDGTKRCVFSDGSERVRDVTEDCLRDD